MDSHFKLELEELRQKVLLMASRAETAVTQSVQALINRDRNLALLVSDNDESIDLLEVEIDRLAILLLTKAPLAGDLRLVTVSMKISQNLERIGDEASKIAKRARDLAREPALTLQLEISRMAALATGLVGDALNAFTQADSAAARAIIPRDKEADALYKHINRMLAEHMAGNPETVGRCLNWIVAVKSLERIADHGKNIAEEVVFLCEAEDVRHALKN